ncbi:MAG: hypothetical protein JW714_01130 [Candidatus Omnitrophica bacterium]|nr:hypothetical protein [Candidatus Omnitrophota bacterium]
MSKFSNNILKPIIKPTIIIIIVGVWLFVYHSEAFGAAHYRKYDVLPKSDLGSALLGAGVCIGLPFVTYGLGSAIGAFSQAGVQATAQTGSQLGSIGSFLLNPSGLQGMQGIVGNMMIYHSASTVGQGLTKAGQLCWGMSPSGSQLLGMVGSSATMFGLGAITNPVGISGIYQPQGALHNFAKSYPITTGLATGASFGALTGGISLGVQQGLKGSVPPGTASAIGSLAGTTLGAGLWGGLTYPLTGAGTDFASGFATSVWGNTSDGLRQFGKEMALRTIDIGITWGAEESGMDPQCASILGSTGSMLIGNVSGLREPTQITNDNRINAFLEPAIYGAASWGMTELTKNIDEPYMANLTNMGTMLVASSLSSGIHALVNNDEPYTPLGIKIGGRSGVFVEGIAIDTFRYGVQTAGFGTDVGIRMVSDPDKPFLGGGGLRTDYTGTVQLNKLWDFSGLSNYALQMDKIRHGDNGGGWKYVSNGQKGWMRGWHLQKPYDKKGGNWRAVDILGSPLHSWANRAGSVARYRTIRTLETSSYSLVKAVQPLDPSKHSSPEIRAGFALLSPDRQAELRWEINRSLEPAVYYPVTMDGKTIGLEVRTLEKEFTFGKGTYRVFDKFSGETKQSLPDFNKPLTTQPPQSNSGVNDLDSYLRQKGVNSIPPVTTQPSW